MLAAVGASSIDELFDDVPEEVRLRRGLELPAALSEAERPGLLLHKVPLDLGQIARSQTSAMEAQFEAKGVRLRTDMGTALVEADPQRLQQVAANLLSNALRYTEEGEVGVRTWADGSEAVLEVSDTGIGIPEDDLPKIFTRFWRGEKSRSRSTGGAGIGLAIADELVKAHGGRFEVESTPGKGSIFRVLLPRPHS